MDADLVIANGWEGEIYYDITMDMYQDEDE